MQSVALDYFIIHSQKEILGSEAATSSPSSSHFDSLYQQAIESPRKSEDPQNISHTESEEMQKQKPEEIEKPGSEDHSHKREAVAGSPEDHHRVEGKKKESDTSKKHSEVSLKESEHIDLEEISSLGHSVVGQEAMPVAEEKGLLGQSEDKAKALNVNAEKHVAVNTHHSGTSRMQELSERIQVPQDTLSEKHTEQSEKNGLSLRQERAQSSAQRSIETLLQEHRGEGALSEKKEEGLSLIQGQRILQKDVDEKEIRVDVFLPRILTHLQKSGGTLPIGELAKAFRGTVFPQIVQHAAVLLDSHDNGELRLMLHPRNLGEVRILLQFEENNIVGRIWVDNANVREVFEQNMQNLSAALAEKGFEASNLEVFIRDDERESSEETTTQNAFLDEQKEEGTSAQVNYILDAMQMVNVLV